MKMMRSKTDPPWMNPFRALEQVHEEMNRLFGGSPWAAFGDGLWNDGWTPAVDVHETREAVLVRADLPGMTKDDVQIFVQGNTLTIRGEKKHEEEVKEGDTVRSERFWGTFHREIALSAEIDAEKVKATYKDGVLELILPKTEGAKPRQIRVEPGETKG